MTSISSLNALLRPNDDLKIIIMDKKTYISYRLSQHRAPNVLVCLEIVLLRTKKNWIMSLILKGR